MRKRHKFPEKKEGVRTTCNKCGSDIVCRMSRYDNFENKLQWQNEDGQAHYQRVDGKLACRMPIHGDESMKVGDFASGTTGNLDKEWD